MGTADRRMRWQPPDSRSGRPAPRSGYEVVVNVGLEGVDDASAVVGCDLDVLVYFSGRVDSDASP